jgi:hypothetical protein
VDGVLEGADQNLAAPIALVVVTAVVALAIRRRVPGAHAGAAVPSRDLIDPRAGGAAGTGTSTPRPGHAVPPAQEELGTLAVGTRESRRP